MEGGPAATASPPASDPRFSRLTPGLLAGGVPGAPLPPGASALRPAGCLLMLITTCGKQRWSAPCWPLATGPPVQAARLASVSLCSHGIRCPLPDLAQRDLDVGASNLLGVEGLQPRAPAGRRSQEASVHQQQPPCTAEPKIWSRRPPPCSPGEQGDIRYCPGTGNRDRQPACLPKECSLPLV